MNTAKLRAAHKILKGNFKMVGSEPQAEALGYLLDNLDELIERYEMFDKMEDAGN
jgi:hypothetical protein